MTSGLGASVGNGGSGASGIATGVRWPVPPWKFGVAAMNGDRGDI